MSMTSSQTENLLKLAAGIVRQILEHRFQALQDLGHNEIQNQHNEGNRPEIFSIDIGSDDEV